MKKLFKNPKTRTRNLILVILPFVILAGVCGFITFKSIKSMSDNASGTSTEAYKDSIDSMDYHLRSNATKLQTELFKDLTKAVESGDKAEIAKLVAENYVADFYTWTNKDGTYDIGGMYYVYSPQKTTIYAQARNTYYKYLTYYINTYGSDKLLEVESIDAAVDSEIRTYEFEGKTYSAYFVTCTWTYKNEDTFKDIYLKGYADSVEEENRKFVTKEYFLIIENEDGRFEIVQAYGDI